MTTSGAQQGIRPGVCLSTTRPASPYIGQIIYMTDVNQSAVWNGTSWEGLDRSRDRNVIINGAMQVTQRGASTASITAGGYYTADRWASTVTSLGTWTQSIEGDAPTGSGLRKSVKMLCTTASASPSSNSRVLVGQYVEGQNAQPFSKGTSSAKQFALSFWVKSNVTGTYIASIYDNDNTRSVCASYTISTSATWEKKTLIFPADTTGPLDNDSALSLAVEFYLSAGSSFTSGTLNTAWNAHSASNHAVGQVNVAAAINNYWQVTGVQFEVGPVATPFEFEDYSETLRKCQRYYFRLNSGATETPWVLAYARSTTVLDGVLQFPVPMRVAPTSIEFSSIGALQPTIVLTAISALTYIAPSPYTANLVATTTGLTQYRPYFISNNGLSGFIGLNAEL